MYTYKNFIHWCMFPKAYRSNSITFGNFLTTYAGKVRKCHKNCLECKFCQTGLKFENVALSPTLLIYSLSAQRYIIPSVKTYL